MKNFMIFAHARSGSSTLVKIIAANGLSVEFEPFNLGHHPYINWIPKKGFDETVDIILSKKDGIKHIFNQIKKTNNEKLIKRLPTIFLYRKNILDAAISLAISHKTNIWQSKQVKFKENYMKPIKLSQKQVIKYIRIIQKSINYYREIIENNKNYITVTYEDLYSENGLQKVKEILGFLNVPLINEKKTLELLSPKYKLNKKPWHETIKNYKEIKKMFIKIM